MTDRDATPAERLQAYLDGCNEIEARDEEHKLGNRIDHLGWSDRPTAELTRADLRAVLAEHQEMRETLVAMSTEWNIGHHSLGGIWTGVTNYTEAGARHHAAASDGFPVRRLVGEWQPADDDSSSEGDHA